MKTFAVRTLCALALLLAVVCGTETPSSAQGIDPAEHGGEVGAKLATRASLTASEVVNTLKLAIGGDMNAMIALGTKYLLPAAIALTFLIVGYMFASFVGRLIGTSVTRKLDITLGKFLGKMAKNIIMLLVLLGILGFFGVDVTSFAAILAAAGFAIGMALQGTLSNFAAGIMLLVFRPFKVGDYVKVSDCEGIIDEIDLFTTRLNSLDHRHLIVPNSEIFGTTIENVTHNEVRRVDVNVGVEYAADITVTRRVFEQAIAGIAGSVAHPAPQVYLVELGDSSVNWQLRVWCRPNAYWDVRERVTAAGKQALDRAGISIPFPQMDIHVKQNAAELASRARAA